MIFTLIDEREIILYNNNKINNKIKSNKNNYNNYINYKVVKTFHQLVFQYMNQIV